MMFSSMRSWFSRVAAISTVLLAANACTGVDATDDDGSSGLSTGSGPGSTPYNEDVNCESDTDCMTGEVCGAGVCQMDRCAEKFQSLAPMGNNHYFGTDGELAIISDDTYVDGFEPSSEGYLNSWNLEQYGGKVVDVAGGDFTGERPQGVAVAMEFSDVVRIRQGSQITEFNVAIWPTAIAAGDVDADGLDEVIAFAEDGTISVCHVDTKICQAAKLPGAKGKDVAVADVDGDGYDEAVFLFEKNDKSDIVVWNIDHELTGDKESKGWELSFPVRALSAGRFVADGPESVVLLEDRGWWGFKDDRVHMFSTTAEEITLSKDVNGETLDVAVGDRDSDDLDEIVILRKDKQYQVLSFADATLSSEGIFPVTVGSKATRLSIVDWNGDSASGRLVEGPKLVSGEVVPLAMLNFPPYPAKVAKGALNAGIAMGNTESSDQSVSETVALNLGLAVGYGVETPVFKAKVTGYLNKSFSNTKTLTKSVAIGQSFAAYAQPDFHGTDYALVVLSCGCFHRYSYVTEDPSFRIGGSGQTVDLFIPVGGQTTLWSTKRYNAMAKAVGGLPIIEPNTKIGVIDSFPGEAKTLTGAPIPEEDLVFLDTPLYQASDVGFTGFRLSAAESETNALAESTTIGVKGSFGAGGVSVDADVGLGFTQGYSVNIGKSTLFTGRIPPIPDDPKTPEDEYKIHRYAFQPVVYREHYVNAQGEDAGFYVITYAVK